MSISNKDVMKAAGGAAGTAVAAYAINNVLQNKEKWGQLLQSGAAHFLSHKILKLAVIGIEGSGKTSFLRFLSNIENLEKDQNNYKFGFSDSNNHDFRVEHICFDSEQVENIYSIYPKVVSVSNLILFFFDMSKIDNGDYLQDVVDRLAVISEYCQLYKNKRDEKMVLVIPTHKDFLPADKLPIQKGILRAALSKDSSAKYFNENPNLILDTFNTRNVESLKSLRDAICKIYLNI